MRATIWIGLGAFLALPGCLTGNELDALNPTEGNQPPAVNSNAQSVDGLDVGDRLMEAGEYELALRAYYRAAADHGLNADVLSAIGSADLKLGRLGQAESILRQAIKEDPTNIPAINNLGVVLMSLGRYGEAKSYFQQAYALDSGNSDEIRQNLKLAIAQSENTGYSDDDQTEEPQFSLVRRGEGQYELLSNL